NIGVELGQLMFVGTMVLLALLLQRLKHPRVLQKVEMLVVYAIGGLSTFWVFERLSTF
ncbi:MAG: HupE/UreJ family protein, partial [Epsilonproteobacteria bacterium]